MAIKREPVRTAPVVTPLKHAAVAELLAESHSPPSSPSSVPASPARVESLLNEENPRHGRSPSFEGGSKHDHAGLKKSKSSHSSRTLLGGRLRSGSERATGSERDLRSKEKKEKKSGSARNLVITPPPAAPQDAVKATSSSTSDSSNRKSTSSSLSLSRSGSASKLSIKAEERSPISSSPLSNSGDKKSNRIP